MEGMGGNTDDTMGDPGVEGERGCHPCYRSEYMGVSRTGPPATAARVVCQRRLHPTCLKWSHKGFSHFHDAMIPHSLLGGSALAALDEPTEQADTVRRPRHVA